MSPTGLKIEKPTLGDGLEQTFETNLGFQMKLIFLITGRWCCLIGAFLLLGTLTACMEGGPFVKPYSAVIKNGKAYQSPEECYMAAKALVESKGGKLSAPGDQVVQWKVTELFWLFEFDRHSVIIFPINWSERNYHYTFISGKVKKYSNLQDDLKPFYTPQTRPAYTFPTMQMNSSIRPEYMVGIEGYFLGESWERLRDLEHSHGSFGGGFTKESQQLASSARGNHFSLDFIDSRLVYASASRDGSGRWVSISGPEFLDSPKLSVRLSGSISLDEKGSVKAVSGR